jgi:hypothetical protein
VPPAQLELAEQLVELTPRWREEDFVGATARGTAGSKKKRTNS